MSGEGISIFPILKGRQKTRGNESYAKEGHSICKVQKYFKGKITDRVLEVRIWLAYSSEFLCMREVYRDRDERLGGFRRNV